MTSSFEEAPKQFWQECQDTCYQHACRVTEILALALKHGRQVISDTMCLIAAFESVRLEMVYLVSCCPVERRREVWKETARGLEVGLKTLKLLKGLTRVAPDCINSLLDIVDTLRLDGLLQQEFDERPNSYNAASGADQRMVPEDLNQLHPFSPYRLARNSLLSSTPRSSVSASPPPSNGATTILRAPESNLRSTTVSHGDDISNDVPRVQEEVDGFATLTDVDFRRIASEHRELLGWDPMLFGATGVGEYDWEGGAVRVGVMA